ncbi:uncharacterized protein LOC132257303 [Phlebotomus argentipes]|uniref:uncharacterized protein LOC132257303 n=1 Tax=Phlebotomus argentipes TaxID=94469 RepID=UPI002893705C|nr:uncharacterized protein LOC132257303 [Phlebotomus argentipes]
MWDPRRFDDIEDFTVVDADAQETILGDFEVVPHEKTGPNCFMMQQLRKQYEDELRSLLDSGNFNCPGKSTDNPEAASIALIEKEIRKNLAMFPNGLSFSSKLRLAKPNVLEDVDVMVNQRIPIFFNKNYFKLRPKDTDEPGTSNGVKQEPPQRTHGKNELYLQFSDSNNINYSFPLPPKSR